MFLSNGLCPIFIKHIIPQNKDTHLAAQTLIRPIQHYSFDWVTKKKDKLDVAVHFPDMIR